MRDPIALAYEDQEYTPGAARRDRGEAVVAAVKVCESVEADELAALVGDWLASYKRPSRVVFVAEVPACHRERCCEEC